MQVKIKSETRVFDDFFKIDQAILQYERFDGTLTPEISRLNFNRGHSVAVLLYQEDQDQLWFTRQFRYPVYVSDPRRAWLLEIIAGTLEPDELPEVTAQREVLEETGFQIQHLDLIGEFFLSPGGTSEKIYLFTATVNAADRVGTGGGLATEGEDIRIEAYSFQEALHMLKTGEICDAKTIIALQWLAQQRSQASR